MSHDRHLNNSPSNSMGLMEAWMHAGFQIMQKDPKPADQNLGAAMMYFQIKGQWEDMAFMRLPLSSPTTVERIKQGFEQRNLDPRISHAFDIVRDLYPAVTNHVPNGQVFDRVREGVRLYKVPAAETMTVEPAANEPSAMGAVA